jgi:hypothetical protein
MVVPSVDGKSNNRGRNNSSTTTTTTTTTTTKTTTTKTTSNNKNSNNNKTTNNKNNNGQVNNNKNTNNNNGVMNPNSNQSGGGWVNTNNNNKNNNQPTNNGNNMQSFQNQNAPANHKASTPSKPSTNKNSSKKLTFKSILGVALGTTISNAVNSLLNSGYTVSNYNNNTVYLTNVKMFNYTWPNATMYYTNGNLGSSEFTYSTSGYDRSRYNQVYSSLVSQYGYPVSVQNNGNNNISCTWWGYNNDYITLSFFNDYAYNGASRYYTTLYIGNSNY